MACTPLRARELRALAAGTLEPVQASALIEHAAGCPACADELGAGGVTGATAARSGSFARLLPLAAGVLALGLILILVARGGGPRETSSPVERLAALVPRPAPTDVGPDLARALEPYAAGDWAAAAEALEARLAREPGDAIAAVFLGVARLEMHQHERAVLALRRALITDDIALRDEAQWYLAHALLALGKGHVALHQLEDLESSGGGFADRARAKAVAVRAALGMPVR